MMPTKTPEVNAMVLNIDASQPAAASDNPNSARNCGRAIGSLPMFIAAATPQNVAANIAGQWVSRCITSPGPGA